MARYEYMVGVPTVGIQPKYATVELDLSNEETSVPCMGLVQWHDKRSENPTLWAWRLLHPVNN